MKLDEITKIKQTTDEAEVNEYLSRGYKIVKIFSTKIKSSEDDREAEVKPSYVLGLSKEKAKIE